MKTVSIINLKGGVCKTITGINVSHILATKFNKRVLLIDNDKQGNTSKFLNMHSYDKPCVSDILLNLKQAKDVICKTEYKNLDLLPSNMTLLQANSQVASRMSIQALTIFKKALEPIQNHYDICIIDNPPDINASVINALNISDEVIVPIVIDQFSFDGFDQLEDQFEDAKQLNPKLKFKGCLITRYDKKEEIYLDQKDIEKYKIFKTRIRRTQKVSGSTFANTPIIEFSNRCGAAKDYQKFVSEYFNLN